MTNVYQMQRQGAKARRILESADRISTLCGYDPLTDAAEIFEAATGGGFGALLVTHAMIEADETDASPAVVAGVYQMLENRVTNPQPADPFEGIV